MRIGAFEKNSPVSASAAAVADRRRVPHRNLYAASEDEAAKQPLPANSSQKPLAANLSDAEFMKNFGKSKAEFAKLVHLFCVKYVGGRKQTDFFAIHNNNQPGWQQLELKQAKGLL